MDVPWKKRADLSVTRHDGGGWVVKDPVRLEYALLDDVEYSVLQALDGRTSMATLVERLLRQFPGRELTAADVAAFVRSLAGHQLVRPLFSAGHLDSGATRPPVIPRVVPRAIRGAGQLLRLQVPLFHPRPVLDRLLPVVRRVVTPATLTLAMLAGLLAAALVALQFRHLTVSLPRVSQFLGADNVLALMLIFVGVKLLHELAHALTARHFGADCHECGIMLLIFTPVLYTNVTDSWTLPRRQRMWVTASGILVELFIASVCLLLWWQATDGPLRAMLLNTVLLCSVNTLLFNGNPLLRFDGYFLLSDALGVPNLSERAMRAVRATLVSAVTGLTAPLGESRRDRRVLLTYGAAAVCYRVLLTLAIVGVVRVMATVWHLEFVGAIVTWALVLGSLVLPAAGFLLTVGATAATSDKPSARWRSLLVLIGLIVIGCIPVPHSVRAPARIEPTSDPIYTPLAGRIRLPMPPDGQLRADETIAVLENPDLLLDQQRYVSRTADLQTQLAIIEQDPREETRPLLPTLRTALQSSQQQQAAFAAELQSLTVTTPVDGCLFSPPDRLRGEVQDDQAWQTEALSDHNAGIWLERGTLLGYVGQPWDCHTQVVVSESQISQIAVGQAVSVCLAGHETLLSGEVTDVSREPLRTVAEELVVAGVVSAQSDEGGVRPLETLYAVTVSLKPQGVAPALYQVGTARIQTPPQSLLTRFVKFVRASF